MPQPVVEALRRGFDAMMRDPDFLAAAHKMKMHLNPLTGEQMQDMVNGVINAPREVVEKYIAAVNAH